MKSFEHEKCSFCLMMTMMKRCSTDLHGKAGATWRWDRPPASRYGPNHNIMPRQRPMEFTCQPAIAGSCFLCSPEMGPLANSRVAKGQFALEEATSRQRSRVGGQGSAAFGHVLS